ncbi:protein MNN4-like [Argentina anserina]|uniref:protein MNN4-like n=1 Tax=Argentina anserina TaxID=57926 RepID=UPI0021765449|nr:protein MNN4-like [Potentilla anserina]
MYHCSRRLQSTFTRVRLHHHQQQQQQRQRQPFCSKSRHDGLSSYDESLKKLDKLDFATAAKMLFTEPPPKNKKFGLDFHLVQLFFACMPSFAVYLVAQYARYEMRKMEADQEQKRKKEEEEEKVKEIELSAAKEKEARSAPEILEVRERLEKLEEAVKEIAVESKKHMVNDQAKGHEGDIPKKSMGTEASTLNSSESSRPVEKDPLKQDSVEPKPAAGKNGLSGSAKAPNASPEKTIQDGGPSEDAKT